jgi:hypothetical protein
MGADLEDNDSAVLAEIDFDDGTWVDGLRKQTSDIIRCSGPHQPS